MKESRPRAVSPAKRDAAEPIPDGRTTLMPIERRVVARDVDAVFRRRLQTLVVLAVLATAAAFLLLHYTGVLKRG